MTTKFSQFPEGGNVRVGDKIVGLRDGENTQFNMPGTGIQDTEGNFLVAWSAADNAVNYMQYINADTGDYPILEAKGQDAAVGLNINTKGNADIKLNMGTGGLDINGSVAINEISNDDTFSSASDEMLSTSLSTKTYIAAHGGDGVTLTSAGIAGGTTSLVNDGTGPALAIKGVVGSTNIAVTTNSTDTTVAITGTIPIANGGTNNTAIGASGTIAQSDGSKWASTTATYPATAGTSGTILRSNGTNIVNSTPTFPNTATSGKIMRGDGTNWTETTAQYPNTAGTSGNVLTSDGTNFISTALTAASFGTLWRNSGNYTGESFSWTTSYQALASFGAGNWVLATPNADFTAAVDGQLKYTGAAAKTFLVSAYLSVVTSGAGFTIALYVNGALVVGSESPSPNFGMCTIQNFPVTLNNNDYIALYGKRVAAAANQIVQMSLSARSV